MALLPVTVVVPVRNEERNLLACLGCLGQFQEVVVVDSGSTDRTRDIALACGATLVDFVWDGKYPKKRNWLLKTYEFKTPWVFFVDADEYVTSGFVEELKSMLSTTDMAGFWINYNNHFLGQLLKHGIPQRKLALFRIGAGMYEFIREENWSALDMEVHEHPVLSGSAGEIRARVDHRDFKTLHHFFDRHNSYSTWEAARFAQLQFSPSQIDHLTPRQKAKYRNIHRWWYAPAYFLLSYVGRLGFLDGRTGYTFALFKMFYFIQVRRKILERLQGQATGCCP
jgi:glycosyltransferase involved in cell wall biosynthesis